MDKTIIIPDVHGRNFWKSAPKDANLIFLGDYLDPYLDEEEFQEYDSYSDPNLFKKLKENLLEIIQVKKERPNDVILLLGNHDLPYMDIGEFCCRYTTDLQQIKEYKSIFNENRDLFQLCYTLNTEKEKYLFSHAGITEPWINEHPELFSDIKEEDLPQYINKLFKEKDIYLYRALNEASFYRGGWTIAGSLVWADLQEMGNFNILKGYYQIIGHSQLKKDPYIGEDFCCIDTRTWYDLNDLEQRINGRNRSN